MTSGHHPHLIAATVLCAAGFESGQAHLSSSIRPLAGNVIIPQSRVVDRQKEITPTNVIEFGSEEFTRLAERLADEGRQGSIALRGEILLMVGNETVLVR